MDYTEQHCYMNDEETIAYHGEPYYAYWITYKDGMQIHLHAKKELTDKEIRDLHKSGKVLE